MQTAKLPTHIKNIPLPQRKSPQEACAFRHQIVAMSKVLFIL